MFCFPARATGVEQAQEAADDPVSGSDSKYEGSGNRKQEQGSKQKCCHQLISRRQALEPPFSLMLPL
jgi:hypothetical protein